MLIALKMLNWSWKMLKYHIIVADVCQFFWTRFYCIIDRDFLGNCNQLSSQVFEEEKLYSGYYCTMGISASEKRINSGG